MSSSKPIFLKPGMSVVVDGVEMTYEEVKDSKIDSILLRRYLKEMARESAE